MGEVTMENTMEILKNIKNGATIWYSSCIPDNYPKNMRTLIWKYIFVPICFCFVVLEKTLESPLDRKEIQPLYPKGNQSWMFIGRTDAEAGTPKLKLMWPPDVKNWLTGKDPDAGKDWRQEEKGATEDEMIGWHHQLNRHEFE